MKNIEKWDISSYNEDDLPALRKAGYLPLLSALLSSRGFNTPEKAREFLSDSPGLLSDPFLLADMDKAVARIRRAVAENERVAVYGDYDVDGITSACLVSDYLRKKGLYCEAYIPERLTEGYGISDEALLGIKERGVTLIITVDCGITAAPQAALARTMGIDMVITDHHECPDELPEAAAVVNPHRKDCSYPFKGLAGVGVAFKLLCALEGPENLERVLDRYGDLTAIGTIADIMPVIGENRAIVRQGLEVLRKSRRLGLLKLMEETGITPARISPADISFALIPKLNAAGRMGKVEISYDLLMTEDEKNAAKLAAELCMLNHERRQIENKIFTEAVATIESAPEIGCPIVLASDTWHHGVSGIVASRLADRYGVPAVVICIEDGRGRGSCRSFGGLCVFDALEASKEYLSSYGGHAHAAGLTLLQEDIDAFTKSMNDYFRSHREMAGALSLKVDFEIRDVSMLTIADIDALSGMAPWGNRNPPPLLSLSGAYLESLIPIGGEKHLKLKIVKDNQVIECVFFAMTAGEFGFKPGSAIDIAFEPVVNEFRGNRTVQLILRDARPSKPRGARELELCMSFFKGGGLSHSEKRLLLPCRDDFASVWRYIRARPGRMNASRDACVSEIAQGTGASGPGKVYICLRVFNELELIGLREENGGMSIVIPDKTTKADLNDSRILSELKR